MTRHISKTCRPKIPCKLLYVDCSRVPALTLVGSIGRKSLDQAMGPGQHASANEKKRKKHTNTEDWFGAVLQLADRAFVDNNKKSVLSSMDYGDCFAPHSLTLDLRLRMYGTFPLLFSHLPDRFGCIGSADVGPASKTLVAASFRGTCISHSFGIRGRLSSSLSGPFLGSIRNKKKKNTYIQNLNLHADIPGSGFGEVTWR